MQVASEPGQPGSSPADFARHRRRAAPRAAWHAAPRPGPVWTSGTSVQ
jgi:hypothetical protein